MLVIRTNIKTELNDEVIEIEFKDGELELIDGDWSNYGVKDGVFYVCCSTGEQTNYYSMSEIRAIRTLDKKEVLGLV